jgi:hypothetical protein
VKRKGKQAGFAGFAEQAAVQRAGEIFGEQRDDVEAHVFSGAGRRAEIPLRRMFAGPFFCERPLSSCAPATCRFPFGAA